MASNPNPTYDLSAGTDLIATNLATNSYVIGDAIYSKTLNTSFWNALTPKTTLPVGQGDKLVSLVYDASLPTTAANGTTVGVNWTAVGQDPQSATVLNSSTNGQLNVGAAENVVGATEGLAYAKWTKKMLDYSLYITRIKSPWLDVNDFRTAAGIQKQVAALMKALTGTVRWAWERRHQTEYEKTAGWLVSCRTASTPILSNVNLDGDSDNDDLFFGAPLTSVRFLTSSSSDGDVTPTAYISNGVLDAVYDRLRIITPPEEAWGNDNGQPVFALVISSKASLALKRESGIRDDVRKSSFVDSLLKPLGVQESFRGFYHMTQPDMPRFTMSAGILTRVEPLDEKGNYNSAYDTATYEAAYVVHKEVLECQVPTPTVLAPGVNFNPVNYMGDWTFVNNKDNVANILGDKGYYFGTLASATKPKNYEYGYVIIYDRTSTTPAVPA
jgi:hypothetical protein